MLTYRRTNLFESTSQTLVNTVNCVGVMGKGIAKEFRNREPEMFDTYKQICNEDLLKPGMLWLWRGSENWVLNFPTKVHWRNASKIEWIEAGLQKFVSTYEEQGIAEISFPRLGCGNGGLDWDEVRPLMEHYLSELSIPVYVHDHEVNIGIPEHLEPLKKEIGRQVASDFSYGSFLLTIKKVVEIAGNNLEDLRSNQQFTANFSNDNCLHIVTKSDTWHFDEDDLRGVWLEMLDGLLTEKEAGWSAEGAARPLVSLLSLHPQLRPIEIQHKDKHYSELALEISSSVRGSSSVGKQTDLFA